MGDQKYLPLIFPFLVTCLLTKTRGVQDFLEEDKEKKRINIPVPPTFYDSFRVSKVGNFTTGVGKVTNFIFTQLYSGGSWTIISKEWTTAINNNVCKTILVIGENERVSICFVTLGPRTISFQNTQVWDFPFKQRNWRRSHGVGEGSVCLTTTSFAS